MKRERRPASKRQIEKRLSAAGRTRKEKFEAENLLYGGPAPTNKKYDEDYHPEALVEFFRDRYKKVVDAERNLNDRGDLKYVPKPVRIPTFSAFAAEIDVARETIWAWAKKHSEFQDAVDRAKAIQEACLVELGTIGALNAQVTIFSLKNLQGWSEKADIDLHGRVELTFDAQDAEA